MRTTTQQQPRLFRGRVQAQSGSVVDVAPTRTEFRDRMRSTNSGWVFHFETKAHADGFNFAVEQGGCVRFDLDLGPGRQATRIFIGSREVQPKSGHFIVCPKP